MTNPPDTGLAAPRAAEDISPEPPEPPEPGSTPAPPQRVALDLSGAVEGAAVRLIPLTAKAHLADVDAFYRAAPDYWAMVNGTPPGPAEAAGFFTDTPPGCDPTQSVRLGVVAAPAPVALSGLIELSFGFPNPEDAYLGLMILGPWLQGRGVGHAVLPMLEQIARERGAPRLCLAVVEANTRGQAFWRREGFRPTGIRREMQTAAGTHVVHRLEKPLG